MQLDPPSADIVPGTLPAAGPYHPCAALGGQSLSDIQMSADGRRLVAIGVLGEAVVLDAATLAIRGSFARARGPFTAVALSANGAFLAAGNERDGELDVFRVDDHTLVRAIALGEAYSVFGGAVALTADGARAAATVGPNVAVVDVATGAIQRYTDGVRCCSNAMFFVDGDRRLVTARYSFDSTGSGSPAVTLLDLATGALATLVEKGDIYGFATLVVSADGSTIATARSGDLTVWDAATGTARPVASTLQTIVGFKLLGVDATGSVGIAHVSAMRAYVETARIADGTTVDDLPLDYPLTPAAWSLDSGVLIVGVQSAGDDEPTIGSVYVAGRRALARACAGQRGYAESFATAAPRVLARIGAARRVFDAVSGQPIGPIFAAGETADPDAISPDGTHVVWSDYQSQQGSPVRIADGVTGDERLLGTVNYFCAALAISPDDRWVAAQGPLGELTIFDAVGATTVANLGAGSAPGMLVGFSADGSGIRSEENGSLQLLDWRGGRTTVEETIPASWLLSVSADGSTIISTSGNTTDAVYVRGKLTQVLPQSDGNGCVGWEPIAAVSADGAWAAITTSCSRPWQPAVPPHVDLYDLGSGALLQSFQNGWLSLSSDGAVLADGAALWCR